MTSVDSQPLTIQTPTNGLTLTAYRGVGAVLLAIDLDPQRLTNLAGFAILGVLVANGRIYTVSNGFHSSIKWIIDNQRLIKKGA